MLMKMENKSNDMLQVESVQLAWFHLYMVFSKLDLKHFLLKECNLRGGCGLKMGFGIMKMEHLMLAVQVRALLSKVFVRLSAGYYPLSPGEDNYCVRKNNDEYNPHGLKYPEMVPMHCDIQPGTTNAWWGSELDIIEARDPRTNQPNSQSKTASPHTVSESLTQLDQKWI